MYVEYQMTHFYGITVQILWAKRLILYNVLAHGRFLNNYLI